MLYQEYEELKIKYSKSQKVYDEMLSKREVNLQQGKIGQLKKLKEAKLIMQERAYLLRLKREELGASKEKEDLIYYLRFVKKLKIYQIAIKTNYSERQINRIVNKIKGKL